MQQLPIDSAIPEILEALRHSSALVLSAAPGAGKTTRLPPELLSLTQEAVWVLEPRRIAATSSSQRIAEERGWELGKEVGYQVRFENKSSRETRLLFLTEALLLRKLLTNPELQGVGCVVLDEFHERSLHVDLALGALKEAQELSRPDLKIVVMSATLNAVPLARYLGGAPVVEVPGKVFPLEIQYEKKSQLLRTGPEFTERMAGLVRSAAREGPGDILCFLPGRGEIERLRRELADWAESSGMALLPLHGQLSLEEQKTALRPQARRKIVLATNVAESSLTVDGVSIVVDSGLARLSQTHPRTGFSSLDLVRISKASATQRAGRAARQGPGRAYRAWTAYDELSMKDFEAPEVERSDLAEPVLLLSALGVAKPETFSWFEAPPARALEQAKEFLLSIGAIEEQGALTDLGKGLQALPVHPRIGCLLLEGKRKGCGSLAAELAALLAESGGRLPHFGVEEAENDLWLRWQEQKRNPKFSVKKASEQLRQLLEKIPGLEERKSGNLEMESVSLALAAYRDRLCRRRRPREPQAKMAGGRGVKLHSDSSVRGSEFFVAIDLSEGRDAAETLVYQAVGIPTRLIEEEILPLASPMVSLDWEDNRFWATETKSWHGLSVGKEHRRPAEPGEVEGRLAEIAAAKFDLLRARNQALGDWWDRLSFLHEKKPEWPLLSEGQLREALEQACYGETSWEKLQDKHLVPYFENSIAPEHAQALQRECPSTWTAPTGNRLRLSYNKEQGVQVEVRLQELFGLSEGPKICGQPLTLVLLAPNFRPVQVTRDLPSFWKNGYPEVRKEMRARYPTHSWPEDPLSAEPQSKGRPKNMG
jgi:ATP-dependent helicase HrpB